MTEQPNRLDFIDNLRWVLIFFVVGIHAAATYSGIGAWFDTNPTAPDPLSLLVMVCFQATLQAFFMGLMFFLAGYFVPTSYDRKGFGRFLADRAFRLGLPTLLFVFVIQIGMEIFQLGWCARSGLSPLRAYRNYLTNWHWIDGTGPMWFAAALLFFSLIYALVRLAVRRAPACRATAVPSLGALLAGGVAVAVVTFLVRFVAPFGSSWHHFQLCFFPQYIVLFVLGIVARRRGWIAALPLRWGRPALWIALLGAPLTMAALLIVNNLTHGTFDDARGGWHWQAAVYAIWEQVFCVLFCVGLLVVFREAFNLRNRLIGFLSDNGFAVYVIHPPVLVAITLAMRPLAWPPLAMFATAWVAALVASFAAGALLRQLPGLKRIL
jgi:peptidoglycan/LPS O-acetylase OafA/YrhL